MPEYRCDPLTGQTVIIAEERAARPHQFDIEIDNKNTKHSQCPFCEGNESMTPYELAAYRPVGSPSDSTGWQVRVFLNKYPAVCCDTGHHEVIVETPRHILSVSEMTDSETENMFSIYKDRLAALRQENRWAFVQIFKNVGAAAGASIPHSHSQLIAMPFIPNSTVRLLQNAARYRADTGRCYWCEMLNTELKKQKRIIEETEDFILLCPFASRFAGEVQVFPKEHQSGFDEIQNIPAFASLVKRTVRRLEKSTSKISKDLAYNFVLHSSPFIMPPETTASTIAASITAGNEGDRLYHWSLLILPSLARAAGFEWGTGLHINPVSPETAASQLKASCS